MLAAAVSAGCAPRAGTSAAQTSGAGGSASVRTTSGEPGLEVLAWSTDAGEAVLARALAPYAARSIAPGGLSPESEAFLASHGLRIISVPVADLESLRVALGAPPRHMNQWLGQAVVWTEAFSGPEQPRGQTIALESERLRLGPGRLRMLARAWISPAPAAAGVMTIELLPQHDEEGRAAAVNALVPPTSIAATEEGLVFSRLLTRMCVSSSDMAMVIIGLRPDMDLSKAAQVAPVADAPRAITDGEAGAAPSVGQVVRQGAGAAPSVGYETGASASDAQPGLSGPAGPAAARAPTLGEAMLSPPVWIPPRKAPGKQEGEADKRPIQTTPRRLVIALVPRLPERVRLLP